MSIFATISQYARMLNNLDQWLETAAAHAQAKGFDPEVLVQARLAPDQFPFSRQIQIACDTAKVGASRLAGKEAPSLPDTEQTLEALRATPSGIRQRLERERSLSSEETTVHATVSAEGAPPAEPAPAAADAAPVAGRKSPSAMPRAS